MNMLTNKGEQIDALKRNKQTNKRLNKEISTLIK